MPRRAKGPRLYLRKARLDRRTGKPIPAVWVIRDGTSEISTGCGADSPLADREARLAEYLASKWEPGQEGPVLPTDRSPRNPASVLIADVIAYYAEKRVPRLSGDHVTIKGFLSVLLDWWGDRTCADVVRSNCEAYVDWRCSQRRRGFKDQAAAPFVSDQTARRELEELASALSYWHGEYPFLALPKVHLPDKAESPRDALTRSQAAALLLGAMGWRKSAVTGSWKRLPKDQRANRRHLRRFILIALYTGPRHTVILRLLWEEALNQAWVDLDAGVIYRRGRGERDHRNKRRPIVKIPPRLLAHMRRWCRLDVEREALLQKHDPDFRLLSVIHHGGRPLAGRIRTGFEGCVRDAGLPPEVTPHFLRHTAATWLMQAGVDPWKAAGFLGMTVATLEKHYGHHHPDYQGEAAGAIGGRRA